MGYWSRQAYGSNSPNARGRRQALDRTFLLKTGACPLPQIISNTDPMTFLSIPDKVNARCACQAEQYYTEEFHHYTEEFHRSQTTDSLLLATKVSECRANLTVRGAEQ